MSALDGLLFVLLDCGSLDISILDDVGYDLGDIAVELQEEGVKVTLNNIIDAIFVKGRTNSKMLSRRRFQNLRVKETSAKRVQTNTKSCRNRLTNWNAATRRKMWSGSATVLTPRFGSEITKRFTGSISRMRFQTSKRIWDLNFRRREDG